jgi:transposase
MLMAKLSTEQRDAEVVKMLRAGATSLAVAERFGVSRDYATHLCGRLRRRHNLPPAVKSPTGENSERNQAILEQLQLGATAAQVAEQFGLAPDYSTNLCAKLRKSAGISQYRIRGYNRRRPCIEPEYQEALIELRRAVGDAFLRQRLGSLAEVFDEGKTLEVIRLHAALRVLTLDAVDLITVVHRAIRQRQRDELAELAEGMAQ